MKFIIQSLIPGLFLMFLAFFSGTHSNLLIAFAGFLSFFVMGITLIAEGYRRYYLKNKP